ncbi:necrosis-and ethylene-inducing protein 1 precursor [Pyrenophora tritici-repentis]|uniref:Necrosis inducing protein n=2 Tax=Pyrenophora tritici-repentis TaxID=45151 RepID=A0A2W1D5D0_9PLEO|nr:uncharacterized protein PTRG_10591 [Pyrenophora tritici-repentis Pt-1C-BFP]KAA8621256.1 necrosis-and ethylene-inducing protein 1 precursor [Pyrenophora tritici-repentis]EDU43641.1 hypothetical protein PTRG_10591 [Pyrenophora tritici-repentis Pt-1C-BFP]KAF7450492.1 necrosis-and ethylene-inducing protein 1 precursor [Pyrenophora tritici-repentis]KAF7573110.1 necrosis-and ethylene-inducing protein 1 precursor [Pyrenophora tritici-repentis]KAG9381284.1 necrosis-and ethylene-inducing protein 1 p
MFNLRTLSIQLLAAASIVLASPLALNTRTLVNHDAVVGFPEAVPGTLSGKLMLRHKPYLKVFNGCVPFPAVDAAGNTGGGLSPTGGSNDGCSSSPGQVYARAGEYNGAWAIMYSWYMPKDSPATSLGHRHDWEGIVVWLSSYTETATVRGVAISAHGGYSKHPQPALQNGHPTIGYYSYYPLNHQLISTEEVGTWQPLIAWGNLTPAARKALQDTDFGAAEPPFKDGRFENHLAQAFI